MVVLWNGSGLSSLLPFEGGSAPLITLSFSLDCSLGLGWEPGHF